MYEANGFKNREEYLKNLAEEYDVSLGFVTALSILLGPEEDFDALVSMIEEQLDIWT